MTKNDDLWRAILDDPDNDNLRLVYADWLEEHGCPERAEFIRVQIALGEIDAGDPEGAHLWQRQWALLASHRTAWEAELPNLPPGVFWGGFRRGFVDEVRAMQGRELLVATEAIQAASPLRRLTLICNSGEVAVTGSPLLARVRELTLLRNSFSYPVQVMDDHVFEEVLAWPELNRLTHLHLQGPAIGPTSIAALARAGLSQLIHFTLKSTFRNELSLEPLFESPWFPGLEVLSLEHRPLSGTSLQLLCNRLAPGRLRRLTLENAPLTNADAVHLAQSGLLSELALLDLRRNAIGATGTRALVGALPSTARLLLDDNPISDEGLKALAESPLLARLSELRCGRGKIGDEGVGAVARSPHAHHLKTIYLVQQQVGSAGLQALLTSPHLGALKLLNLEGNRIEVLPVCRHPTVEGLHLDHNRLSGEALNAFCGASNLPALQRLTLKGNDLGVEAAQALSSALGLPSLTRLVLAENSLGDAGAVALMAGNGLPALADLDVQDCVISEAALNTWEKSPRLASLKKMELSSEYNPIDSQTYTAFCAAAYRQGCDVDSWSRRPRLRPIRRPTQGTRLPPEERAALTLWINHLHYAEYHTVGWLKAVSLAKLRTAVHAPNDLRDLERYQAAAGHDVELCQAVIGLFLGEWLVNQVPESVGVWGLESAEFRPVPRTEALTLVDAILTASLEAESANIRGLPPQYLTSEATPLEEFVLTGHEDQEDIPYHQLRVWFAEELFDAAEANFFVHTTPGGSTVRFNHSQPRVIGMDRHIIGVMWLE